MFANNLKKLRMNKSLSLSELADRLNKNYNVKFSKATLARWEDGQSSPSIAHASALAHYFNVTLDQLSGYELMSENKNDYVKESPSTYMTETIAAHIDDDVTEEEMEEILAYIEMKKSLRKNRK